MKKLLSIIAISLCVKCAAAQNALPVLKSTSNIITIHDGAHVIIKGWGLDPKAKPDVYHVNIPEKNSKVTFISNIDSISFDTRFGQEYDFVVLLNDKDSCYTRIAATYDGINRPAKTAGPMVIPFTMKGSRIFFNGTLNGRASMSVQFDLGAGGSCINKNSVAKGGVKFNGKTILHNTQGVNETPTSSDNGLTIAGLKWDHIPLVQTGNMNNDEDMLIGNSLFADKILEIDYDKKVMIVHDQLPNIPAGYTSHDVFYEQHRPKIQAAFVVGDKTYTDWFLFDTGRDGTMLIGEDISGKNGIWDQFNTVMVLGHKKIIRLKQLSIGGLTFKDIVTNAADPDKPAGRQSLLGNELLDHFNVILDNKNGVIYLKPNTLQNNSFADWHDFRLKCIGLVAGVLAILTGVILLIRLLLHRKKQN